MPLSRAELASRLRNLVFGVEDSLVSTVGLLSGVAIAGVARETILLTGVVLIFVEAFSMAAGTFLSEASEEDFLRIKTLSGRSSFIDGVVMFISYFISGFIPLSPYLFFSDGAAFHVSIGGSLIALLLLGLWGGHVSKASIWKSALRMFLVGGLAILVGIGAGQLVS